MNKDIEELVPRYKPEDTEDDGECGWSEQDEEKK
jgi:hypothetical protein